MRRNAFYVLVGIIAFLEVSLLWLAIEVNNALLIQAGFVVGIILVYLARGTVTDVIEDERTIQISQQSALRTLEIFWVVIFLMSLGSIVLSFNRPFFVIFRGYPPPPVEFPSFGIFGFIQLFFLVLIIFLYVGFRVYYARKYGEFESDEE
jgi:Predicted membrane protein